MTTKATSYTELLPGYEPDASVPFIVCTPAGTVIAKNNIKSRKASTELEGASLFDYVDTVDKIRVSEFISSTVISEDRYPSVRFEIKAIHGYHYAFAELIKGFGNIYLVVYLFATKKDFLKSATHREKQMNAVIADHKRKLSRKSVCENSYSADDTLGHLFSESVAFSEMLDVFYNFEEKNSPFNIAEANERIISFFSCGNGSSLTDCDFAKRDLTRTGSPEIFITNRDLTNYTKLMCALIFVLTRISCDRRIMVSTECFSECARITVSTCTENKSLLSFRSTDIHALSELIPSAALRIMIADCIAARTGVKILSEGYLSSGEFAFSLTVTDNAVKHLEFKHGNAFENYTDCIDDAVYRIFPGSIANSK